MKILHVITALNVGGAETMLARLVDHERMQGGAMKPSVVSLMPPGAAGERIRASGVPLHHCGMRGATDLLPGLARLRAVINREQPDLIMAWMYHAHLATRLGTLLRPGNAPVIWNVRHSIDDLAQEKPMMRAIVRMAALFSSWPRMIVYNSHAAAAQHRRLGFHAERMMVIPNGFDCDLFRPRQEARDRLVRDLGVAPGALIVGMAARNHPMKDAANLVEAVLRARECGTDVHLLLTGQGMDSPPEPLQHLLAALPADRLTLRSHDRALAELLPGLDVLALPSAWGEGFPNIVGEAMACGLPCIATDVGDSSWIIGRSGIIVPPRDPARLAEAIMTMDKLGRDGRRRLGETGRARIQGEFSMGTIAARYQQLYQHVRSPLLEEREAANPPRQAKVM
ncbi:MULTISPECIES: glycosyltransferase [Sphingobium]|uniref:glycosyltransferase n=1 Tax=Sphingobium sp. MI1205 TaxID=407020 RepID=UPI00076FF600|nr:glycosyltransferase [Sphingobium sp. MI1205]AMK19272.1 group 1 glycosyl transferase [Sphingobium sp. MI1205]